MRKERRWVEKRSSSTTAVANYQDMLLPRRARIAELLMGRNQMSCTTSRLQEWGGLQEWKYPVEGAYLQNLISTACCPQTFLLTDKRLMRLMMVVQTAGLSPLLWHETIANNGFWGRMKCHRGRFYFQDDLLWESMQSCSLLRAVLLQPFKFNLFLCFCPGNSCRKMFLEVFFCSSASGVQPLKGFFYLHLCGWQKTRKCQHRVIIGCKWEV